MATNKRRHQTTTMGITNMRVFFATVTCVLAVARGGVSLPFPCPETCQCTSGDKSVNCGEGTTLETLKNLPSDTSYLHIHNSQNLPLTNSTFIHLHGLLTLKLTKNENLTLHGNPLDALQQLQELDLSENGFDDTNTDEIKLPSSVIHLDLRGNYLTEIPFGLIQAGEKLAHLNLGHNNISTLQAKKIDSDLSQKTNTTSIEVPSNLTSKELQLTLKTLDLSHNTITTLENDCFINFTELRELNLDHNEIALINPRSFHGLNNLTHLSLSHNPILSIPPRVWKTNKQLLMLNISHLANLTSIDSDGFFGLDRLNTLYLSGNSHLTYIHALIFQYLTTAKFIDLRHNALSSIDEATFQNLTGLERVYLAGNPWTCNCETHWLGPRLANITAGVMNGLSKLFDPYDFLCASPPELRGSYLIDILPTHNFSCHGARVVNFTEVVYHAIGSAAMLDCVAEGDPRPHITWVTPRHYVLRYQPSFVHPGRPGPESTAFHKTHPWHQSMVYDNSFPDHQRIHVLPNGSLYIDYVLRRDAGPFTCLVFNQHGNETVKIHFRLDVTIARTMVRSVIVGFIAAGCFFLIGMASGVIRYLAYKCSREQRQKRKSVHEILEGLELYRTDKMDKLSAYKTAKIDQLAAFKTAKVDKLRGYKNITVQSLLQYLHKSREHYAGQTMKIRENCAQQVEKVRESYSLQKLKFKDYRSHQVDKVKDNYNGQLLKIRQYSSSQLSGLRDQYKLQQQHILKLLELLDIGNCMTVIEAECMRSESMIFNQDLTFDLETTVYLPSNDNSGDNSQSEYITAGDTSDNASEHSQDGAINLQVLKYANELLANEMPNEQEPKVTDLHEQQEEKNNLISSEKSSENPIEAEPEIRQNVDMSTKKPKEASTKEASTKEASTKEASTKEASTKTRTPKKKHRPKPKREESLDDEDEIIERRPLRKRTTSKERKDKREQKRQQASQTIEPLEPLHVPPKSPKSAKEINETLQEIAESLRKLRREPISLSLPELNFELTQGISTDDERTPLQDINPNDQYSYIIPSTSQNPTLVLNGAQGSAASLRQGFRQDSYSTDYESAQESLRSTPHTGFYEHTGSPQSFGSFSSTPSTPTLGSGRGHHVVLINHETQSRPQHQASESNV